MNPNIAVDEHPVIGDVKLFDKMSGTWFERLIFNNRSVVVVLCLLATVVLGFQSGNLRLAASYEKMIPLGHPYVANYMAHRKELAGLGNVIRIAVENKSGTIYDASYLEALRKINDEIFLIKGVERPYMKSLWTPATRWIGVTEDGLDGGPVMPDNYDGSEASLGQVRANVERSGEIGQLVASNLRSSIVVVPLMETDDEGRRLDYRELSNRLEQLRSKYNSDKIQLHITGFAKVVGDLINGLHQVLMFFAGAIVICMVVLFTYTRCIRSTVLVVACSIVAVIWLLGLLPLLGYELDPYSILVPFLVFAIGMSHGAQKMNGIMQDIGRGTHRLVAARYTFRRLFLAGLTALLADAVGFAVLMIIDIRVIKDLATTASIGVAVLIFTNLVLLPILLSYWGVSPKAAARSLEAETAFTSDDNHKKHLFWAFLDLFTQAKYARIAIAIMIVLGAFGLVVSSHLRIGDLDPGAPELRPDSRYNLDNKFMAENYATSSDIYVIMVKTPQYQCANYATLSKIDALEWELQQLPGVESTNSIAQQTKVASVGLNEGSLLWYGIPRSQDLINSIIVRAPRELFNQNCDLATIYVYLKDHRADTLEQVVSAVENYSKANDTDSVKFLQAAGNAGIEAATNIVVKASNREMLLLVYAAVTLLALIAFKSWRAVICAVLPLALTSILCEALMVILGIGVKVATLPVIALGVGIGVDYSLYIMAVTLVRLKEGMTLSEAYYNSLIFTGRVVVLTGVTLGIAVATWVFSPIKFQADMGILLSFMFIVNMLGALILLPALSFYLLPKRPIPV